MLLRFVVENFRSIGPSQELSFVATSLSGGETQVLEHQALRGRKALPAIVVYGANASGKSNLLSALVTMRNIIRYSHAQSSGTSRLPYQPFLLDDDCSRSPTTFEIDFIIDGIRYIYGFAYTAERIEREWLHSFPKFLPRKLFERDGANFDFGRELKGQNKTISELTRPNSLFLSAGQQNNHSELTAIFRFFEGMTTDKSIELSGGLAQARIIQDSNGQIDGRVISYLRGIGTGVSGYQLKKREETDDTRKFTKAFSQFLKEITGEDTEVPSLPLDAVELQHSTKNGKEVYFSLDDESSGTIRLLTFLPKIYNALDNGNFLAIDEIDISLHTKAAASLLNLFNSSETNRHGAQLLATTHDTNLLERNYLRRDQVWFTEKDASGATTLFPLSDFNTRPNDDFEKGYLDGRFGALPTKWF
jgi:AAA15 family ATPase/GTPase